MRPATGFAVGLPSRQPMSKLAAKIRAQFIGLLLVFAIALLGVASAGAWGLGQTAAAANKLYGDHLQTAQVTAALAQNLDDAYETAGSVALNWQEQPRPAAGYRGGISQRP
jgi:hypothetical protein